MVQEFVDNGFFISKGKKKKNIVYYLEYLLLILMEWGYKFLLLFGRKQTPKKFYLSFCSIFKNEAPYMKEWIEYHLLVGVDHFYLYNNNSTDKLIKTLLSIPGLCSFGVWMFKFLDRHGLLPKKIIDASPFHESLLISNLASIRTNHIYHHVYEFGTTSVGITMGNPRVVPRLSRDEVVFERTLPLGVVMDERICSGHYFANAFAVLISKKT